MRPCLKKSKYNNTTNNNRLVWVNIQQMMDFLCKYMDLNLIPCIQIKIKTIKCGDGSDVPRVRKWDS